MLVLVTLPESWNARRFAQKLVEQRLAAGITVLDGAYSIYWWQDRICEAGERVLLAHVSSERFEDFKQAVTSAHPYEVPCIVGIETPAMLDAFNEWLKRNSGKA